MNGWSPQEREEFRVLMDAAVAANDGTTARVDAMELLMNDAVQAHRPWAHELDRECRRAGYASRIKRYLKEHATVLVAHNGVLLNKPRIIGTTRRSKDGRAFAVQTLFDQMTWDELIEKRAEYLKQVRAYDSNIAMIDRLLALRDLAAEATSTPEEAAKLTGTTVELWLAGSAAA